jgi:hypothetical protein
LTIPVIVQSGGFQETFTLVRIKVDPRKGITFICNKEGGKLVEIIPSHPTQPTGWIEVNPVKKT